MGRTGATRALPLKECAEVLPGFSVRGRMEHDPAGTHQLVLSRHLTEGVRYVYAPDHELRIVLGRDTAKYEVGTGDVLFMSRGTRNLAWVIGEVPQPTVAPVSFFILRPLNGADPTYLAWYLNQPSAQAAIEQIRTGAGTPIVQRKAFEQIEITLPPLEIQRQIAELAWLMARERQLMEQLTNAVHRAHAVIGQQIIENLRSTGGAHERSK